MNNKTIGYGDDRREYLTYFNELGLADPILQAVTEAGYTSPTPIQRDVIPAMNAGRDVIGIAQTGTGKTAAFVLPILNKIAAGGKRPAPKTCGTLILSPTRELASQIADNARIYSKHMNVSVCVIVGGVKPGPQIKACARGVDIIVATPGRLLDLKQSGAVRLDQTTTVVADEADHMMDMGFLPSVRKIMQALPKNRQTILCSATMPTQIRALAKDFMQNPDEISVTPVSKPIERIEQIVKRVEKSEKRAELVSILSEKEITRAVVFTRTKHGANKVAQHLVGHGINALAIHGNKSQAQREKALASFKAGHTRILVATDIAARGIDIDDVSHVVNFELPNISESYVHRIGRTARAGRSGMAISLCSQEEVKLVRDIEKLTGQKLLTGSDASAPSSEGGQGAGKPARRSNGGRSDGRSRNNRDTRDNQGQNRNRQGQNRGRSAQSGKQSDAGNSAHHNSSTRTDRNSDQKRTSHRGQTSSDAASDGMMRMLGEKNSTVTQQTAHSGRV